MPLMHVAPAPGRNHPAAEPAGLHVSPGSRASMLEPQLCIGVPGRVPWNSGGIPPHIAPILCGGERGWNMIQVKRRVRRALLPPVHEPGSGGHSTAPGASKLKVKPAGKPGSVTGIAPYDGHSSRRRVAPALQPPTRGLERAAHSTPACTCSIRLFGVAPGGGYRVSPAASFATNSRLAPLLGREDAATRLCGPIPRLRRRQACD